jgi:hypothetical protein
MLCVSYGEASLAKAVAEAKLAKADLGIIASAHACDPLREPRLGKPASIGGLRVGKPARHSSQAVAP